MGSGPPARVPEPQHGFPAPSKGFQVPQDGFPAPSMGPVAPSKGSPVPHDGFRSPQCLRKGNPGGLGFTTPTCTVYIKSGGSYGPSDAFLTKGHLEMLKFLLPDEADWSVGHGCFRAIFNSWLNKTGAAEAGSSSTGDRNHLLMIGSDSFCYNRSNDQPAASTNRSLPSPNFIISYLSSLSNYFCPWLTSSIISSDSHWFCAT